MQLPQDPGVPGARCPRGPRGQRSKPGNSGSVQTKGAQSRVSTVEVFAMVLYDALAELEAQSGGVGKPLCLEVLIGALDRLRHCVDDMGGLPVSLDRRNMILAVSDDDLAEVIFPLCTWLKGLTEACTGEAARGESQQS